MTVHLITGHEGRNHVTSDDMGHLQAEMFRSGNKGRFVINGCTAIMTTANNCRVASGALFIDGRYVRITSDEDVTIENGSQGYKRYDLVVMRYSADEYGAEKCELRAIKGTPTTGTPAEPAYQDGSIYDGDDPVEVPLFRIPVTNLSVGTPVAKLGSYIFPVNTADLANSSVTAAKIYKSDLINMVYPVGSVYLSYSSISPASLFGGTWVRISSGFLKAGSTATGGANSHTHTAGTLSTALVFDNMGGGWMDARVIAAPESWQATWSYHITETVSATTSTKNNSVDIVGSSSSSSNVPAYQELYVWRRTA